MFLTRTPAPALLAGMIRQRVMNITLTMFAVDDENVEDMYNWIEENITYDKISIGVHKNASRHHVHFGLTGVFNAKLFCVGCLGRGLFNCPVFPFAC